jgi:hypothetical protein
MGLTLMADDRDLIIGELREGVRAIKEHLRRQDDVALARDQQLEINKREAIKARQEKEERDDQKHAENTRKLDVMDRKLSTTYGVSTMNDKWITDTGKPAVEWVDDHGRPLVNRVVALEALNAQADKAKIRIEGETRGRAWMAAKIIAGVVAIGGLLGWLGADRISAILFSIAVRLGHE